MKIVGTYRLPLLNSSVALLAGLLLALSLLKKSLWHQDLVLGGSGTVQSHQYGPMHGLSPSRNCSVWCILDLEM